MRLPSFKKSLEHRLRAARPEVPEELAHRITGEMTSHRGRRTVMRPQIRTALVTGIVAIGIAAVGGAGYAMTYVGDTIGSVKAVVVHTRTQVRTVVVNAANDQYGTTTTQTTTTTQAVAAQGTTTTANGSVSTSVPKSTSGSVTVAPSTNTSVKTSVKWSPSTFSTAVKITVNPAPAVAQPAFVGPVADQIVQITITDPVTGQVIHQLAAPLEIVFSNAPKGYVPAVSEDGVSFRPLKLLSGTTLPAGQQDGYYVDSDGTTVHVLTMHLTQFAVLYKANLTVSESGRKLQPAGSGKFGDPTRIHVGAPKLDVLTPTVSGSNVRLSLFVDEQVALYLTALSNGSALVMDGSSTIRKHTIGGKSRKNFHVVILRPGTINLNLHIPGVKPGTKIQVTVVDYDGNKVSKTVTAS